MVWKQILRDLKKEWSWALFYALVTSLMLVGAVLVSFSYRYYIKEMAPARKFVDNNVYYFQSMQLPDNLRVDMSGDVRFKELLREAFLEEGNAGSYVSGMPVDGFEDMTIVLGKYIDLMGLECPGETRAYVGKGAADRVGSTLEFEGIPVQVAGILPKDFQIYFPTDAFRPTDGAYDQMLILCVRDLETAEEMFPWWGIGNAIRERLILVDPDPQQIDFIQRSALSAGSVYYANSVESHLKTSTEPLMRNYRTVLLFFVFTAVLLVVLLVCNVLRMVEAKVADYTVHHLYGAPVRLIQRRVGGFVLVINALPALCACYYPLRDPETYTLAALPAVAALLAGLYLFVSWYVKKRIGTLKGLGNLRRDY